MELLLFLTSWICFRDVLSCCYFKPTWKIFVGWCGVDVISHTPGKVFFLGGEVDAISHPIRKSFVGDVELLLFHTPFEKACQGGWGVKFSLSPPLGKVLYGGVELLLFHTCPGKFVSCGVEVLVFHFVKWRGGFATILHPPGDICRGDDLLLFHASL
jgi:hypothetical protein